MREAMPWDILGVLTRVLTVEGHDGFSGATGAGGFRWGERKAWHDATPYQRFTDGREKVCRDAQGGNTSGHPRGVNGQRSGENPALLSRILLHGKGFRLSV
jgi:hypothetical protein